MSVISEKAKPVKEDTDWDFNVCVGTRPNWDPPVLLVMREDGSEGVTLPITKKQADHLIEMGMCYQG